MNQNAQSEPVPQGGNASKMEWHSLMMAAWLFVALVLVIAGCATPAIEGSEVTGFGGNTCRIKYGYFTVKGDCVGVSFSVASANSAQLGCGAVKSHLQAGAAFAIFSVFLLALALAIVVAQDVLGLFSVFNLLAAAATGAALFCMFLVWAITAGLHTRALCTSQFPGSQSNSKQGGRYGPAFFLFLITWILTILVTVVFALRMLKIF